MEEGKKNIRFTAEDIRKYLDGELTGPEMQAMEKAALEDPFLADAMEGYEESRKQPASFESDMTDLQNRLAERTKQQKRKNRILIQMKWQVAASIFIIAGATLFTFIYITRSTNKVEIAKTEKKDSGAIKSQPLPGASADTTGNTPANPASADSDIKSIASDQPSTKEQMLPGKKAKTTVQRDLISGADRKSPETSAGNFYHKDNDSIAHPDITGSQENEDKAISPAPVILTPELSGKAAGLEVKSQKIASQHISSPNFIAGIIVNEKDQPIPNVAVSLPHSNKGITTDSKGYFKIYLKNSDSVGRIAVNHVGYQPVSTELKANDSINIRIQLQPVSTSLNDVVVIGYGSADKSEYENPGSEESSKSRGLYSSLPDSLVNKDASPGIGWTAYQHYLDVNKKILSADSVLKGTEILIFELNAKGELSVFKFIQSISPTHDAEIIRLIKTGPEWKINKGKKQKCRISLQFP